MIRFIINNTRDSVVNVDKLTYARNQESPTDIELDKSYSSERFNISNPFELKQVFTERNLVL